MTPSARLGWARLGSGRLCKKDAAIIGIRESEALKTENRRMLKEFDVEGGQMLLYLLPLFQRL